MIIIEGRIVTGMGCARYNLKFQMPFFIEVFPEIKDCYLGSINVELGKPLKIFNPDFETNSIKWSPDDKNFEEKFSFTRIKFEIEEQLVDAWIYGPHKSPHRVNPFYIEIIAPEIKLGNNKLCRIHLDKNYSESPFIII
ncbi:MAG: hypothetical protein Q8N62_07635 [Candidatus Omnitrophota bacterium]|nr:hypothetical protein [Candidatus Omnitrophota bacterium]